MNKSIVYTFGAFISAAIVAFIFTPVALQAVDLLTDPGEDSSLIHTQKTANDFCISRYSKPCPHFFSAQSRYDSGLRANDSEGQFIPEE